MSKQKKKLKPSVGRCRVCLVNSVGKKRLAYGHTVCVICSKKHNIEEMLDE